MALAAIATVPSPDKVDKTFPPGKCSEPGFVGMPIQHNIFNDILIGTKCNPPVVRAAPVFPAHDAEIQDQGAQNVEKLVWESAKFGILPNGTQGFGYRISRCLPHS